MSPGFNNGWIKPKTKALSERQTFLLCKTFWTLQHIYPSELGINIILREILKKDKKDNEQTVNLHFQYQELPCFNRYITEIDNKNEE